MYGTHRVFDWDLQNQFARISCDYNPIHIDPVVARRTHAGAPIVHGIHALVWILDCFAQSPLCVPGAASLKAQFLRPIYVGDEVELEISRPTPKLVRARAMIGDEEVVAASIGFEEAHNAKPTYDSHSLPMMPPEVPHERTLQEMAGLTGCLSFGPIVSHVSELYPAAVRAFGLHGIAALVGSSCLVGMVVPGLHSMFSGLEVSLGADEAAPENAIQFAVTSIVPRFRTVRIGIRTRGIHGSLETLSRMPPVRQPSMDSLRGLVSKDEFRSSTALIVGGSRGLGELAGKLIAAGGGRVIITYASGEADAAAVVDEISRAGSECTALAYDVHRAASAQLAALSVAPTHVYYFATPRIFQRKASLFDLERFTEFNSFYVAAFFDLVQACIRLRREGIKVFYPSSVFVDSRPAAMTEYAMSKAAAEVLCADISKFLPGVHVLVRRLPRVPTDQTSSVVQVKTANPVDVMLPIVREMHVAS